MTNADRIIPPHVAEDGSVHYSSVMTPIDDTSLAVCYMVPDRIIPVIFVPGIMGSNLMTTTIPVKPVWLVNSKLSVAKNWLLRGADTRKQAFDPTTTAVYDGGNIPEGTLLSDEELKRRGWGEVAFKSYGSFLPWLENALNDAHSSTDYGRKGLRAELMEQLVADAPGVTLLTHEEVALSYKYQFPVHAVGYNWLQSNAESSERLDAKIVEFMAYYRNKRYMCNYVILVTHSMGGLVARHYTEVLGRSANVLGVVHGVMPATGAAAAYKRVKAGTEGAVGAALGDDAAKMTAVFAQAPGALQLLPSKAYGTGWLKIRDGERSVTLPNEDPYEEIYTQRDRWWGLVDDKLINPFDENKKSIDQDWNSFKSLVLEHVKPFHEDISDKYHVNTYVFFGSSDDHKAWGDVVWVRTVRAGLDGRTPNLVQVFDEPLNAHVVLDTGKGEQTIVESRGGRAATALFVLRDPDEQGDGTVPRRSGEAPGRKVRVCVAYPDVDHEEAYTRLPQQVFSLWAITKIAWRIKYTNMAYKK